MEEKILAAEEDLHAQQKQMEDPAVLADHVKLREVCTKVDERRSLCRRCMSGGRNSSRK